MTTLAEGVFVTGTDTEIGKTVVSAALLAWLADQGIRAAGFKPVASGCRHTSEGLRSADAELLMRYAGVEAPYADVNPYAFEPAIAPHLAALSDGVSLSVPNMVDAYKCLAAKAQAIVVEGVGGWRVPFGPEASCADLAVALELPVVLVVGIRLGCINHALLTAEAIGNDGLTLAGWVANRPAHVGVETEGNVPAIARRIGAPLLADLPYEQPLDPSLLARHFQLPLRSQLFSERLLGEDRVR